MATHNPKPTQIQLFHQAHRQVNDTLQQAAWMAGLLPDDQGEICENPLTEAEIAHLAQSKKPYAWAFQSIREMVARLSIDWERLEELRDTD